MKKDTVIAIASAIMIVAGAVYASNPPLAQGIADSRSEQAAQSEAAGSEVADSRSEQAAQSEAAGSEVADSRSEQAARSEAAGSEVADSRSAAGSEQATRSEQAAQSEVADSSADAGESAGISYEEAIADLYARSTSISDQEILDIARKMEPDYSAVTDELGADKAAQIVETLSNYEDRKAAFLLDNGASASVDGLTFELSEEWERQSAYTQMGISGAQTLTRLIPGYTVTSCREEYGRILIDVDEWMTEGYTEGDQNVENVSAYRYYYTAVLEENTDGNWEVVSVINTDSNYAWLEDAEMQEKLAQNSDDAQKEERKAGAQEIETAGIGNGAEDMENVDIQGRADTVNGMKTASLMTYGDGQYSYNADKAIAYADKWATSRNPEYKQYAGVDCCNFVSQCLYAGGMPKNSAWYPASVAWINCTAAIKNFKNYGTFMSANNGNVLRGNPVYYDWNSNGVYDHTAICVGKNSSGTPIIDAHTGDHYHVTWTLGSNGTRATIQLRGNGSVSGTSTATDAEGGKWQKTDGKWYFYSADGNVIKDSWVKYNNNYYYLQENGNMTTGWSRIGGSWYYFTASGCMKTGWLKYGGNWYYMTSQGSMKTGWQEVGGKWYYFESDGHAVTGRKKIGSYTYYFNSKCAMETGLTEIDGMNYYFDSQGHMKLGWVTVDGDKYFFSPSAGGRAATGAWDINGRTYYFDSDGVLKG